MTRQTAKRDLLAPGGVRWLGAPGLLGEWAAASDTATGSSYCLRRHPEDSVGQRNATVVEGAKVGAVVQVPGEVT